MQRREFLRFSGAAALASMGFPRSTFGQAAVSRPNVLFLSVDDLRPQLGCYGCEGIHSPHIDALAARGTLFEQAYCQQAVSAPSRASLLTGLRPDSTRIYDLHSPVRRVLPDVLSLPQHFRENGYETVSLGKIYHHGKDDNDHGWSTPAWHPSPSEASGPGWKGRGYLTDAAQALIDTGHRKGVGVGPAFEAAEVPDDAYPDGVTAVKAVKELRRLKAAGQPFFLAVGFVKPHLPFNAPQQYWDLYDRDAIEIPRQSDWPEGMPGVAGMGWGELKGYVGIPRDAERLSDELTRTLIHGYNACVSYTDALVGQVVGELQRLGLADNTVIILWGDHGWKLGEYSAWCKHSNFELDTRAPMIVCAPAYPAGGRSARFVEFVDVYPTLAELCGLAIPEHCEGTSMAPLLRVPGRPWKAAAFSQYPRGRMMGYSMRTERWRYTEWIEAAGRTIAARELYDHSRGDVAVRNLAADPEHADTVRRLSAMLSKGQGWKAMQQPL